MTRKISCEEVLSKLFAYLDQEVDSLSQQEIDEHLKGCRECFSRAEFEKALRRKVSSAGEVEPPAGMQQRMASLIRSFDGISRK